MSSLEHVPPEEASQIDSLIKLTRQQMEKNYPSGSAARRAQHAKSHATVTGTLRVRDDLPESRRRGIFATPGHEYQAWIRYSNAAAIAGDDSMVKDRAFVAHASRGMALKILGVPGVPLHSAAGDVDQDFLMVNHPVFPFSNVADYEAVSQAIAASPDGKPDAFFAARIRTLSDGSPDLADPATSRALRTLGIVRRIQSLSITGKPAAFQVPPACPTDNQYFGGAPFMFGDDQVMRVRVVPASPAGDTAPDPGDANYLRTTLVSRLNGSGAAELRFEFQAQVRDTVSLTIDTDIEDACRDWNETVTPFETLAVLTIPPQDFDTAEREAFGETLAFSPWHGVTAHRPLGGINRLRRAVYEASVTHRRGSRGGQP